MTTQALKALEPCPFCAGKDIRFDRHISGSSPTGETWSMCCYQCGATFPNRYKKELLVECWNRRAREAYTGGSGDGVRELSDADIRTVATAVAEEYADRPGFDEGKKMWECHDQYIVREQYVRRRAEELEYEFKRALSAFRAHGYSLARPAMEGWKLVPIEPTREMIERATRHPCVLPGDPDRIWRIMLAASPPSPDNERTPSP